MKLHWTIVALVLVGCSSDGGSKDAGRDAPAVDGGLTPSAVCDRYLTCFKAVKPTQFDEELKLFQAGASCWNTAASSANCEKVCQDGYDNLAQLHTSVKACGGTPPDGATDLGPDVGYLNPTGSSCTVGAKCSGGICLDTLVDAGTSLAMPGGYCSRDCSTTLCQLGEACFKSTDSKGKTLGQYCLRVCTTPADCRTGEGYTCSTVNVCMPGSVSPGG